MNNRVRGSRRRWGAAWAIATLWAVLVSPLMAGGVAIVGTELSDNGDDDGCKLCSYRLC